MSNAEAGALSGLRRKLFHVKQFQQATGVSDDVLGNLEAYLAMLEKWQKSINLVSRNSLKDAWRRHMLDSAQLHPLLPNHAVIVDLGSGAGFPGLVLAIMGNCHVHLIESDARKCAFLAEAARAAGADNVTIHNARAEEMEPFAADVVTARALAPLDTLLGYAQPFVKPSTTCLFLKGEKAEQELTESLKNWTMTTSEIQSQSDPSGKILKIHGVERLNA